MHKSETKFVQGEKVYGREPKIQQNGMSAMNDLSSQNNLDYKEQRVQKDDKCKVVSIQGLGDHVNESLRKSDKEPLTIVNPNPEQPSNELHKFIPIKLLEELQRSIRERDKAKVNPTANQEEIASKELETCPIQMPRIGPKSDHEELHRRRLLAIDHKNMPEEEQTKRHFDVNPFKYHTQLLKSATDQSAGDPSKKPDEFYLLPKIINGGFAGIVGVSLIFPLDFVKTRLQAQVPGPDGQLPYKSIFDCFKKTIKSEGYFGMYRGSAVNIILVTPENAIKLAANDFFRYHLTKPNGELSLIRQMIAGGLAGLLQILVTTPMELLKIRMQMSGQAIAEAKAAGQPVPRVTPFTIVGSLIKENGILGIYKGFTVTALRDVLFSIIYFPLFAAFNEVGPKTPDGSGDTLFWWSFTSGAIAGSVSALIVTPADVVKTRLQNAKKVQGVAPEYLGIADCFAKTMKNEGIKALFKGGACRVMVVAPLFGITQAVYYLGFAENVFGLKNK